MWGSSVASFIKSLGFVHNMQEKTFQFLDMEIPQPVSPQSSSKSRNCCFSFTSSLVSIDFQDGGCNASIVYIRVAIRLIRLHLKSNKNWPGGWFRRLLRLAYGTFLKDCWYETQIFKPLEPIRGQLISEWTFGVFKSPKKRNFFWQSSAQAYKRSQIKK